MLISSATWIASPLALETDTSATHVIPRMTFRHLAGKGEHVPTLTKRLIDATPCPAKGQVFIRDDDLRGFALRLTPGQKTFIVEKRPYKRLHRVTIGQYGACTVEQAAKKPMLCCKLFLREKNPPTSGGDASKK